MDDRNTEQHRYLEEVCAYLNRAGFETRPLEDSQLPVYWNGTPLCRITGKGSVFYRREDVSTPQAEEALIRAEDIAAQTLEYMTANTASNSLHGIGTMTAQAYPMDTTSWRTMMRPSRTSPYEAASSTRSSFSAQSR